MTARRPFPQVAWISHPESRTRCSPPHLPSPSTSSTPIAFAISSPDPNPSINSCNCPIASRIPARSPSGSSSSNCSIAATDRTDLLLDAAQSLFHTWTSESFSPVRLLGMSAEDLAPLNAEGRQLQLFDQPQNEKLRSLDRTLDTLNKKFGPTTIHRAGT
ncbi:MAG TPA: hypothetical protein VM008_09990 [Phycisphaerae bacterium]|nr:hypothetical protein [Phycisphaerae bacterium]